MINVIVYTSPKADKLLGSEDMELLFKRLQDAVSKALTTRRKPLDPKYITVMEMPWRRASKNTPDIYVHAFAPATEERLADLDKLGHYLNLCLKEFIVEKGPLLTAQVMPMMPQAQWRQAFENLTESS